MWITRLLGESRRRRIAVEGIFSFYLLNKVHPQAKEYAISLEDAAECVIPGWSKVARTPARWRWEMFDAPASIEVRFKIRHAERGQRVTCDGRQFIVSSLPSC